MTFLCVYMFRCVNIQFSSYSSSQIDFTLDTLFRHISEMQLRLFPIKTVKLQKNSVHISWDIHYNDVIMDTVASQITSFTIVYSIVYSDADQRKYQSSASLAFVRGIHRRPVNSPHKWPVTRKVFPFDDVIMFNTSLYLLMNSVSFIVGPYIYTDQSRLTT